MRLVSLALAACLAIVSAAALAQGITLGEGETVIAANVATGARFSVIAGQDAVSERVVYIDPQGNRLPLLRVEMQNKGQCLANWALECHEGFGKPQRICFCASIDDNGSRVVATTAGVIVW